MPDSLKRSSHNMASPIVDRVKHLTEALERVTSERERLAFEVRDAHAKERVMKKETDAIQNRLKDARFREQELIQKEQSLQRQLDTYMKKVVELSEAKESLENQLALFKGTAESMTTNHDVLAHRLEHLESASSGYEQKAKSVSATLADCRAQIEILRHENGELRDRLFQSESTRDGLASNNAQLEIALRHSRDKYVFVEGEKDTASTSLKEITRERDLYSEEISVLKRKVTRKTLRILVIGATITSVAIYSIWAYYTLSTEAYNQKLAKSKESIAQLEIAIEEYKGKIQGRDKLLVEKGQEIDAGKDVIARLQEEIKKLNTDIAGIRQENDASVRALRGQKEDLQSEKDQEIRVLEEKHELEIAGLNQKIRTLDNRITLLQRTRGLAIPPLIDALTHQDLSVRVGISNALAELTEKSLGTDQKKWQDWWSRNRTKFER